MLRPSPNHGTQRLPNDDDDDDDKLFGIGSEGAVFTAESLIEHCQVVRSVNSAM